MNVDVGVSAAQPARWETFSHPQRYPNAEDHGTVLKAALGQWQVLLKRLGVEDFGFLVSKTQNSEDMGLMRLFLNVSADESGVASNRQRKLTDKMKYFLNEW